MGVDSWTSWNVWYQWPTIPKGDKCEKNTPWLAFMERAGHKYIYIYTYIHMYVYKNIYT